MSKRRGPHPNRAVVFVWDGDQMTPLPRFKRMCDELFAVHEEYPLVIMRHRSQASLGHYHAELKTAFLNLAEEWARMFSSVDHMRAYALFTEGYATEDIYILADDKAAQAFARKIKDKNRRNEILNIILIEGNVVKEYTPFSQSAKAMGKEEFEESKAAVLARVASWARTTPTQLKQEARRQ